MGTTDRATIDQVAALAGVHASTVSRALHRPDMVNVDTRQRVVEAVERLGYVPNASAQGLARGRTGTIGVVVPDITNPFFALVVQGAGSLARRAGCSLLLAESAHNPVEEVRVVRSMARYTDAIIDCSPGPTSDATMGASGGTPLVFLNREARGIPAVFIDQEAIIRLALDHLLEMGHRRIAVLDGPATNWSARRREEAVASWEDRTANPVVRLATPAPTFEGGAAVADQIVAGGYTGVAAFNDVMALGVIGRLSGLGLRVPHDVSVVGSDDVPMAAMSSPSLTTVAAPCHEAGEAVARLALDVIEGARLDDDPLVLEPHLIRRASCVPPRRV